MLNKDRIDELVRLLGAKEMAGLIDLFVEHVHDYVKDLIKADDAKIIEVKAHNIKSAAGNMGADTLSDQAQQIEQLAKAGDKEQALEAAHGLEEAYNAAAQALRDYPLGD